MLYLSLSIPEEVLRIESFASSQCHSVLQSLVPMKSFSFFPYECSQTCDEIPLKHIYLQHSSALPLAVDIPNLFHFVTSDLSAIVVAASGTASEAYPRAGWLIADKPEYDARQVFFEGESHSVKQIKG